MAVLVTGGAGYIGGHMVLSLRDQGEVPVVVDNMSNGVPWAPIAEVPFYHADVGDYEAMSAIMRRHQVDTIIHFAALLITPETYGKPLDFYLQNTVKSRALIQAAVDNGVKRFVFSGTAAVYGNPETNPVSEEGRVAPLSAYGMSKWVTERMISDAAAVSGMEWVVLRYFNVAGADPQGRYGQSTTKTTLLVQIAVQSALGIRNGIDVFGTDYPTVDGTCVRDYIHVSDLIDAHHAALHHLQAGRGNLLCNVGYGRGFSVKQVIDTAQRISGRDFPVRVAPRRQGDAVEVVADAGRARERLGWKPRYDDLDIIVRHALNWEERMRDRYRFNERAG